MEQNIAQTIEQNLKEHQDDTRPKYIPMLILTTLWILLLLFFVFPLVIPHVLDIYIILAPTPIASALVGGVVGGVVTALSIYILRKIYKYLNLL